jgi:Ni/Fe-hydrogenase subunit HybB-like protein
MSQTTDPILAAIADGFSTGGLPMATANAIFNITRLLRAARSLEDVSVFAAIGSLSNGRFVVPAVGKWSISFRIVSGFGPSDLRLEKLGKSWPEKRSHSSRSKRQVKS